MSQESIKFIQSAAKAIFDKKGINILALDVKGKSEICDYVLIAEGSVDRHVIAIAQEIIDTLENLGEKPLYVEGLQTGDWVVIDYLDFMIHLFMPGLRDKYRLEELFQEGEIINLDLAKDIQSSQG